MLCTMDTFKHIMLVVIALLLAVQIIDRVREPEQMGAVTAALDKTSNSLQRVEAQQRGLEKELAATRNALAELQAGIANGATLQPGIEILATSQLSPKPLMENRVKMKTF